MIGGRCARPYSLSFERSDPLVVLVIDFLHIAIRVCIHAVSRLRTIVFIKSLRGYDVGK